jgi:phosphate transport system substrate-binding protein
MKNASQHTGRLISSSLHAVMLALAVMWGCEPVGPAQGGSKRDKPVRSTETTAIGEIAIGVDVTMEPVMKQIVDAFMEDNPKGIIHATYAPETDVMDSLMDDAYRLAIVSRELRPDEEAVYRRLRISPTVTMIGRDAVVVLLHPENPQDSLTMAQLGRLMRGEAKTWRDIGGTSDDEVKLVFESPKSSTVRMVQEKFLQVGQTLPANAFQAKDQTGVVDYVAQDKNAIGFVGYCQVADRDDPKVQERLAKVQLARLDATDTSDASGYFIRPYQNEIALGRYPLSRPMYAVSREYFLGLGTGFVVYAAGEMGQRIFLKAGIVPEFMPPRLVVFPDKED